MCNVPAFWANFVLQVTKLMLLRLSQPHSPHKVTIKRKGEGVVNFWYQHSYCDKMPSANTALFNQQCTEGNYLLEMPAYLRKGAPQTQKLQWQQKFTQAHLPKRHKLQHKCFWTQPLYQVRNSKEGVNFGITYSIKIKPDNLGNIFPMGTDAI